MVMNALRKGATGGILKFILFGLLILATGGLVLTDAGGFFRSGVSRTDLAKVGTQEISARQFDMLAAGNLRRLGMSPGEAYKIGYLQEMLNGEIRTRLLMQRAGDLGLLVSTEQVAEKLGKILAPMAAPGQTPQDVLKQILMNQGVSEQQLIDGIRAETTVALLGSAIKSGFAGVSQDMLHDLAEFQSEERAVEYIAFPDEEFKNVKAPEEEQLKKMYESLRENYAVPELREGRLILINDESAAAEIPEEEIRAVYNENIEQYKAPENRIIEEAILADAKAGEKVAAAVKDGKNLKEAVHSVTGNTTDYLPGKAVSKEQLPEELRETVFSGKAGEMIGPVETPLGSRIVVVKEIVEARTESYESVRDAILEELKTSKRLDAKYELANTVEDLLASGAAPADLKQEVDATIKDMPPVNAFGLGSDGKSALESFGEDSQKIAEALFRLGGEGESSPVFELADGRMASVFLHALTPRTYKTFEDVKESLEKQWIEDQRRADNKLRVLEILSELQSEKSGLSDAARIHKKQVRKLANLTRAKKPESPLTPQAMTTIFESPENELFALDIEGGAAIARVTSIEMERKLAAEESDRMKSALLREMENEAYALYVETQRKKYGVQVNERLLEQLYSPRQEEPQ